MVGGGKKITLFSLLAINLSEWLQIDPKVNLSPNG